jgi:Ketopantoate reductase PanE/ApbA
MQKQSVLIVGAGALGLITGYHLSLAGAEVTIFVRPSKLAELKTPQLLYCYDDHQLKEFTAYRPIATVAEVAAQRFDYVLVTFDGAVCRSAEGSQLLRELGDAIRPTSAKLIIGGVGIGLRDFYLQTTRLPEDRLMEGTLGSLAYQVQRADMPLHAPTNAALLAKASIAYHHFPNKVGFMLAARPAQAAKEFAALYDRCGVARVSVMNVMLYTILNNTFFPITAVCDLAGWPDAKTMAANQPLMSLCSKSMKEIIGLPQHGWIGKIVRLFISEKMLAKLLSKMERESLPLDFHAFNKFHHGGKVRAQDIQVMQNCVESGEAQGQSMTALRELLRKYQAHCHQQAV